MISVMEERKTFTEVLIWSHGAKHFYDGLTFLVFVYSLNNQQITTENKWMYSNQQFCRKFHNKTILFPSNSIIIFFYLFNSVYLEQPQTYALVKQAQWNMVLLLQQIQFSRNLISSNRNFLPLSSFFFSFPSKTIYICFITFPPSLANFRPIIIIINIKIIDRALDAVKAIRYCSFSVCQS